jgi:hypothetical protein
MTAILGVINSMTFVSPVGGARTWLTGPADTANPVVPARLRLWADVDPAQQPAAFLVTHRETDEYRGLGLLRRRLELGVWCYVRSDSSPGGPMLDIIMEAFETAFIKPDNFSTNSNTLGGLVYWVRIEGNVFKDPGDIDSQALLIVPLVCEMP